MLEAATGKPATEAHAHFPILGVAAPLLLDGEPQPAPAAG
jgi:hypothetical protein